MTSRRQLRSFQLQHLNFYKMYIPGKTWENKKNNAHTLAISPTLYSGLAALTLPRSWLENQKNPDRARFGAFGSFGFLVRRFLHHTGHCQFNSIPLGVNFSHSSHLKINWGPYLMLEI